MAEWRLRGRPASPGFARGPLAVLAPSGPARRTGGGEPAAEQAALRAAIAKALDEIAALAARTPGEAADVLAFQLALLSDEELFSPALAAIAEGTSAHEAWDGALNAEMAGYRDAQDEYFRARAADLADIRDRVACHLNGTAADIALPPGALIIAEDLPPSRFLATDWSGGGAILLAGGSPTSHVAMLARARGVPMVVGLGERVFEAKGEALVEADGTLVVAPDPATADAFERRRAREAELLRLAASLADRPAVTADGTRITVLLNVAEPADLDGIDPARCDGIGLVRTEFLFQGHGDGLRGGLADEEAQFAAYRRLVAWAAGRPVTIRTLDAGGDKPIPGLTMDRESNPFLGIRGIRLSLRRPDVFKVQLRALARAAAEGPLKVMLPMVTVPGELEAARALLAAEVADLRRAGVAAALPPLGIMVEVPAAALALADFDAAFFSIGSNDLTQYVTAAARDNGEVGELADPRHPALLRLFAEAARFGRDSGREVSLCGDAGGDPALIPALLEAGLRSLSMAPSAVARAKVAIAQSSIAQSAIAEPAEARRT